MTFAYQLTFLTILVLGLSTACAAQTQHSADDRAPTLTGDIRLHEAFESRFLGTRDLIVYVPPGYESEGSRHYPVLYMHDGQNLFDGATSYIPGMEWRVDETAERLILNGEIEPVIIVGIYNTGVSRADEYLPTRVSEQMPDGSVVEYGGNADLYGRLIIEELMPFIDEHYRTLKGPENTALGGSSFGGIASLYLGIRHPGVFGELLVVSPSLWWDNGLLIRMTCEMQRQTKQRIWLDMGTAEGPGAVVGTRMLREVMTARGWRLGDDFAYMEDAGAEHNEAAWAGRMESMLKFLYGTD